MIKEIKKQIEKHQEQYAEICEIWANSNGSDIVDDIVSSKFDIAELICDLLYIFNISASATEENDGDHLIVYYWCDELQRDIILKYFTMEEVSDYQNFSELLQDLINEREKDREIIDNADFKKNLFKV